MKIINKDHLANLAQEAKIPVEELEKMAFENGYEVINGTLPPSEEEINDMYEQWLKDNETIKETIMCPSCDGEKMVEKKYRQYRCQRCGYQEVR